MMMRCIPALLCGSLLLTAPAHADEVFSWQKGGAIAEMGPTKDKMCFLSFVSGRFSGAGEEVRMQDFNGRWILWGAAQSDFIAARARCFSNAEIGKPGDVHWVSPQFRIAGVHGCKPAKANAWQGDAMTAVAQISGRLRGQGEYIGVEQSNDGKAASRLVVQSCQSGADAAGAAYSYFVGKPHTGVAARFVGPGGTGTADQAGEFVSTKNGIVEMTPTQTTICYFTRISGGFYDYIDSVSIDVGSDTKKNPIWLLRTTSKGGEGTFARARCYLRKQ